MRFSRRRGTKGEEGDLTPMIDMTFQLIAFFMVLINLERTEQHQEIQLPDSVLAIPPKHEIKEPITIHVTRDGKAILGGQKVDIPNLGILLQREAEGLRNAEDKSVADATVIIRGHKDGKGGYVQEVIDLCQQKEFEKFALRVKEDQDR